MSTPVHDTLAAFDAALCEQPIAVSVVGPTHSGKSIYRWFLSNGLGRFPPYLERTYGVRELPWGRSPGEALRLPLPDMPADTPEGQCSWHTEATGGAAGRSAAGDKIVFGERTYLPGERSTHWITRHPLSLPTQAGGQAEPAVLLDFPGEFARRPSLGRRHLADHEAALTQSAARAIGRSQAVLLVLPFWLLFPGCDRHAQPPHLKALDAARTSLRTTDAAAHAVQASLEGSDRSRADAFLASAEPWIDLLEGVAKSATRTPTLLITFSMFGEDWATHLTPQISAASQHTAQHLAAADALLNDPLLHGVSSEQAQAAVSRWPSWLAPAARGLDALRDATALGTRVDALHQHLHRAVRSSEQAWRAHGDAGANLMTRLSQLLDTWDRSQPARFLAMNLIDERDVQMWSRSGNPPAGARPERPYYRVQARGALLPSLLLASAARSQGPR